MKPESEKKKYEPVSIKIIRLTMKDIVTTSDINLPMDPFDP